MDGSLLSWLAVAFGWEKSREGQVGVDGVLGELGDAPVESVAAEPGLLRGACACDHRLVDGIARLSMWVLRTRWEDTPNSPC